MSVSPSATPPCSPYLTMAQPQPIVDLTVLTAQIFQTPAELCPQIIDFIDEHAHIPPAEVVNLLLYIAADYTKTKQEKQRVFAALAGHPSVLIAMTNLLAGQPVSFLQVFRHIDNETGSQIMGQLSAGLQADFNTVLLTAVMVLAKNPQASHEPKKLLKKLLQSLTGDQLDSFAEHVMASVYLEDLAWLAILLDEDDHLNAFMKAFIGGYDDDDFHDNFQLLVEELCRLVDNGCPLFLNAILNDEQNDWICGRVENQFGSYSTISQACLLWCSDTYHREQIAINYRNQPALVKEWLEFLFKRETAIGVCVTLVRDLTHGFNEEMLFEFLIGMATSDEISPVIPYLYSGLSNEAFATLMILGPELFMQLLDRSLPETHKEIKALAERLQRTPDRLDVLFQQVPLTLSSHVQLTPLATFLHNAAQSNDEGAMAGFAEAFQRVPPFLIALAARNANYRTTLGRFITCLSDSQITAMAACLPPENIVQTLEQFVPPQTAFSTYACLVTNLLKTNLKTYLAFKNRQLAGLFMNFVRDFAGFQAELQGVISLGDQVPAELIQRLYDRANLLMGFIRRVQSPDYAMLEQQALGMVDFLRPEDGGISFLGQPITQTILMAQGPNYDRLMQYLHSQDDQIPSDFQFSNIIGYCGLYQPVLSHHMQVLHRLLANVEDETDTISIDFWNTLTLKNLIELNGMKNANELFALGIRSDQDFACLGLTAAKKRKLEEIKRMIQLRLGALQVLHENTSTACAQLAYPVWERLMHPNLQHSSTDCQSVINELISIYQLPSRNLLELAGFCSSLLQQLQQLEGLNELDRARLVQLQQALASAPDISCCHQTLATALLIIKGHDFLSTLKLYLNQPGLAAIWQGLNARGITCLSQTGLTGEALYQLSTVYQSPVQ